MTTPPTNRLGSASSPYLLQHAHNPVDWYPWGDEALSRARTEDKPIFLSVGYAACHWCHVMENESFEDPDTAAVLNEHFVSIKVDREERPDVDALYMDAVQAMNNGQGGWPMSVFALPTGEPFFAGTYFPREPRFGSPSFRQVLEGIVRAWRDRRDDVRSQAAQITEAIARAAGLESSMEPLGDEIPAEAFVRLATQFDRRWGGFGGAPKFPQPMTLEFALRVSLREVPDALDLVSITLDRMADGGIRDQLGGGFARYSTDATWHVPHFEKMLYDNAQLAQLYTRAWLVTRRDRYRDVAVGIVEELLAEMQHPEGGFFSSRNADSEGVEGAFYVWSWEDLVLHVGERVARAFGATPEGNWNPGGGEEPTNVLWHPIALPELAIELGVPPADLAAEVDEARTTLRDVRATREPPTIDDKIVTAWNALAIRALAEAGTAFGIPSYVEEARRCADFIWHHLRRGDGRLLRSWRDGSAGQTPGFADDHALLVAAYLALYEATSEISWFARARSVADELIDRFSDAGGGFFQAGSDAEQLVVRQKELFDNAVPSGNSAAAEALLRLSMFTGEARYENAAVDALRATRDLLARAPTAFGHALCAYDLLVGPRREIAIVGGLGGTPPDHLVDVVWETYRPNDVLAVASGDEVAEVAAVLPLLDGRLPAAAPQAFVCERFACKAPVGTADELRASLMLGGGAPR